MPVAPSLADVVALAHRHGIVYVHPDEDSPPEAVLIPVGSWWYGKLPPMPLEGETDFEEAWRHEHVFVRGES